MQYRKSAADSFWNYRWNIGAKPKVHFSNTNSKTNVIYTAEELRCVLKRSDEENSFIPVPRSVMENALRSIDSNLSIAA